MGKSACIWWDREFDGAGRLIRQDVRTAAHEIWEEASRRTHAVLADRGAAADLMERSVAQISRYLDRIGAPPSGPKHGLLIVAFSRALWRYKARMRRLEFVGGSLELCQRSIDENWIRQINARLDLESMVHRLSERNGHALMLRAAGFEWPEIAQFFGVSVTVVRNGFWREVQKIRWNFVTPSRAARSGRLSKRGEIA